MLEQEGYHAITCESPGVAHKICETITPSVVLLDATDGFERVSKLVEQFRERCPGVRIVVASSGPSRGVEVRAAPDVVAEARHVGADVVLRKPISPETLLAAIATVLS